jgi:NAD(P)-dependent dehydrogenase (short-subunit alcohol dehydrogenase family)
MPETCDPNQARLFVVTGGTSGIGLAVIRQLIARGHTVIGVGRSEARCGAVTRQLAGSHPVGRLAFAVADLSTQLNVRGLAKDIERRLDAWGEAGLDGMVNNAGTFTFWQTLTPEGFETQWAVNHLAPFLLTNLLLPRLQAKPESRVVTVSSGSHYGARLDWADIQRMRHYNPLKVYKQTKLANILFTMELRRRQGEASGVRAFAADPGLVDTDMGMKVNSRLARWVWSIRRRSGLPAEQAASGIVRLLLDPDVLESSQIYWKDGRPRPPDPAGLDEDAAYRLWELSAQMCGLEQEADAA